MRAFLFALIASALALTACTEDIDLPLPDYQPEIAVEAYVNTAYPSANYVLLTRSADYYKPDFDYEAFAVSDADVFITEGRYTDDGNVVWDEDNQIRLEELTLDETGTGVYADIRQQLDIKPGYRYRLYIRTPDGTELHAQTDVPHLVPLDSIGIQYEPDDQPDTNSAILTPYFQEPQGLGNYYRIMGLKGDSVPLLFGRFDGDFYLSDDGRDGEYYDDELFYGFQQYDTATVMLAAIDLQSYEYLRTLNRALNNGGPFAQPINPKSTITNGLGYFCGMAVSRRTVYLRR